MLRRPLVGSGYENPSRGFAPLCGFTEPTFGAGVNATHCPIARPKRHIQPERYMQYGLNIFEKI
jgi:hypothetical protein